MRIHLLFQTSESVAQCPRLCISTILLYSLCDTCHQSPGWRQQGQIPVLPVFGLVSKGPADKCMIDILQQCLSLSGTPCCLLPSLITTSRRLAEKRWALDEFYNMKQLSTSVRHETPINAKSLSRPRSMGKSKEFVLPIYQYYEGLHT